MRLWDLETGNILMTFSANAKVWSVRVSATGFAFPCMCFGYTYFG